MENVATVPAEIQGNLAAQQGGQGKRRSLERDVRHLDASGCAECLENDVMDRPDAGRPIVELPWVGFRLSDQVLDRPDARFGAGHHK